MEKDELENRIKELELELSLLKSGKVESPLLENESSFYNAGVAPSAQKKVENILKEREQKFKLIFEKSIAPIIIADDKGNYLEVNKAAAEIFEYSINELMSMNVGDLITTSNPNAAAQYEEYIKKGEEIGEFGFISKKGTPKIVQYQAVRIKPDFNLSILMDVSEQKQTSQYARSLIEASLDPLVTISADGKITDVNEASIKVTGVEREKLIDTDFSHYFTEPQKAQEGYQQVFEKGFVADYPLTIKHKNGNLTDVLYNASVYKDDKGNVLGVFAAARDVTLQKQIENELLKTQERLNAGLKIANIALSEISYLTNTVQLSPESAAMYGFPKNQSEVTRQQMHDTFHPAIKAALETQIIIAMNPDSGGYMALEHPIVLPSGEVRWLKVNKQFFYDYSTQPAKPIYSILVSQDITARKKAEEKIKESEVEVRKIKDQLELSITAGKIGVWHWNVINDLLYWSKEQHEIYGFNQSETVTSSAQFNALMVSGDLKRIQDDLSASNKLEHEYDFQIIRKNDGELRWIKSRAKNTFDSQGVLQYISGVNIDITEQKLFEGKLIEAKTSAENAAKSRQQFLSNMSHEIRTPLNSILGFTNVLLKTELDLQQKEFVDAINTSGKSLNLLINDILDLAKVDAGKMIFEKHPIEIRKSISSIVHSFDMKIREKNLELVEVYDNKIPPILVGDSLRLNQIILNLISNAVKFTHKGKIKLTIKLLQEDKENVTIEFVVSDSGIGIADNKLNSIFNLFEQAEINTSTSYGGTGLGLSIVKQLVEGQGGSVSVKSKLGEGSAFSFILPFGKANLKLEEEIIQLNPVSEIKNLRVLVAEDVALNQLLIKIILNDFGFEHEIVGNGKLAIEKMQTNTYDIILMDLQMPEMNGFEATEYIRKTLKSHIPIIALTADVITMDVSKCKEFGMDSYISKPIEEKMLYNKIVELVKKNK